jgi:hypothetical protein
VGGTSLELQSASCQIAYWEDGSLRIANYLIRRTFATESATLDLIRFFFSPRTIADALREFRAYSPRSVSRAILRLIDAQLLLECGSAAWKRDGRLCANDVEIRQGARLSSRSARGRPSLSDVLPNGHEAGTGSLQHGGTARLSDREGPRTGWHFGIGPLCRGGRPCRQPSGAAFQGVQRAASRSGS